MYRLWLACRIAPVHKLPDLSRIQAKTNDIEITITVKQLSPNQVVVLKKAADEQRHGFRWYRDS